MVVVFSIAEYPSAAPEEELRIRGERALTTTACCAAGFTANSTCYLDVRDQVSAKCVGQRQCSIECKPERPDKRICAGINVTDPCSGVHKYLSVSVDCAGDEKLQPATGPAFRDLYPPDPAVGPQPQTEAASGLAAMKAAGTSLIDDSLRTSLGNMLAALVTNHNKSSGSKVTITGGIIDMAHLVPELLNYGHPDVAFDVLAAEGPDTYFNMAKCKSCNAHSSDPLINLPLRSRWSDTMGELEQRKRLRHIFWMR